MKKIVLGLLLMVVFITGCGNKDTSSGTIDKISYKETNKVTNYVKIETSKGTMIIELYPDTAPITVEKFQTLVKDKFYDGLIFHRVIKDFMIQGGDPQGTGIGGSDKKIKGEFEINGVKNDLSHTRGVISMARSQDPDSASSQFFIVHKDSTFLDGQYAAFGKVIAGMNVVDKIAEVQTDNNDKPTVNQTIKSIRFVEIKE